MYVTVQEGAGATVDTRVRHSPAGSRAAETWLMTLEPSWVDQPCRAYSCTWLLYQVTLVEVSTRKNVMYCGQNHLK